MAADTMKRPSFTIELPLFGTCNLMPQEMERKPEGLFCYVSLEGQEESAKLAIYRNGEFLDIRKRPFPEPVTGWFSVEKADGSLVF